MENESGESNLSSSTDSENQLDILTEGLSLSLPRPGESFPTYKEHSLLDGASIEASNYSQVAYEMAVTSALGVISAVCQGLVDVAFPNGYTVPTSLMTLTIAGSGERKSSLDSLFSKPLSDIQQEKDQVYQAENIKYQRDLKNWKLKEKALNRQLQKCHEGMGDCSDIEQRLYALDAERPQAPRVCKLIYSDTTPSALAFGMYENLPIALLRSDEAGALMRGRALDDLYLLNAMWTGSDTVVERRTSESYTLRGARLSVSMMVQPEILKRFLKKKGDEAHDSGFLARLLVSCPEIKTGNRPPPGQPGKMIHVEKFQARVRERLEMSLEAIERNQGRKVLTFSPQASELWKALYSVIECEARADRLYAHAHAHASKLMDNVSRVAALVHTFENDDFDAQISQDDLAYAFNICRHYSGHFMKHIAGQPRVVKLADMLVRAIRRYTAEPPNPNVREFTRSNITQYGNPVFKEHDDFDAAIELLQRLGHIQEHKRRGKVYYQFSETLEHLRSEPELKNGELYYVKELPKFEAQPSPDLLLGGPHKRTGAKHAPGSV